MPHRAFILLLSVLLLASIAAAQEPTGQPAEVTAAIDVSFTSLKPTKNGLQVAVTYV
jgi:hypothetical protein